MMRALLLALPLAAGLLAFPAPRAAHAAGDGVAASQPAFRLRAELTLDRDIVSFGDLIAGLPDELGRQPAFRAPALGASGTIQAARIVEAAVNGAVLADAGQLDRAGVAQVVVTRAARRVAAAEIEAALREALLSRYAFDTRGFALVFDGGAPNVAVEPAATAAPGVSELSYDARSRRLSAQLAVPGSAATRLAPIRLSAQLVETAEVVVPLRAIAKGELVTAADVSLERRPRDLLASDLVGEAKAAVGRMARRALPAGLPLRAPDLQRVEIVGRGDLVTIVYESPGLLISMRGKANDAGALGDVIAITNPQSKRVLQGTVTGQGRVSVNALTGGRIASAE